MAMAPAVQRSAARWLSVGILGGILGGTAMAIFAMVAAATYQDTGFFTPMYHIASATGWTSAGDAMKASMDAATGGDLYLFTAGPALAGFGIHMGTAIFWGLVLALVAWRMRATSALPVVGAIYGLVVMLFMAYAALPVIASIFDSGEPIEKMAQMVGWGTFSAEHAIFGFVTGATLAAGSAAAARRGEAIPRLERRARPAA
jgi:hypothetical protein